MSNTITPLQQKVNSIARGWDAVMSDEELNALAEYDCCADFRSIPNPERVGTKDTYLVWIKDGYQGAHPAILKRNDEINQFIFGK